jgi:hypothetical protein
MNPQKNETDSRQAELVRRIVEPKTTSRPLLDLIIPVGPASIDNLKIGHLAAFMPRALVRLAYKPMLWYILQQVSSIGDQIAAVHLLLTRGPTGMPTWKQVERFIQEEKPPLAEKVKFVDPLDEMDNLTPHIYNLQIESEYFLLHYHDILLGEEGYELYRNLADTHMRAKKRKQRICGTLAVSTEAPEGFRPSSQVPESQDDLRIVQIVQKPFHLVKAIPLEADVRESSGYHLINMAIAIFDTQLLRLTKEISFGKGDFFQRISDIGDALDEMKVLFTTYIYRHKWWHLDTVDDLVEQRKCFEYWERLEFRRQDSTKK